MKKRFFILLLVLCIAAIAVTLLVRRDTRLPQRGALRRIDARFTTNTEWRDCGKCEPPRKQANETLCTDAPDTREDVLEFLFNEPQCADDALAAVARVTPDDLGAAHLLLAERDGRLESLYEAIDATAHARTDAMRFNRALAYEKLLLLQNASDAWSAYLAQDNNSQWAAEARRRRDSIKVINGAAAWATAEKQLNDALDHGDIPAAKAIANKWPRAVRDLLAGFLKKELHARALLLAEAIGDPYSKDMVTGKPGGPLELLDIVQRLGSAVESTADATPVLREIDEIYGTVPYPFIRGQLDHIRGSTYTLIDRHVDAVDAYQRAVDSYLSFHDISDAGRSSSDQAGVQLRLGNRREALRLSLYALQTLPLASAPKTQNNILGNAADVAVAFGHPDIAAEYQRANVTAMEWAFQNRRPGATQNLAIALGNLAALDHSRADTDLRRAWLLSNDKDIPEFRRLSMRIGLLETEAQIAEERGNYDSAITAVDRALKLTTNDTSTVRAKLYLLRATANQLRGDQDAASTDTAKALREISAEGQIVLSSQELSERHRGETFSDYFARYGHIYRKQALAHIEADQFEEAFALSEQARGEEPLSLILNTQNVPAAFALLGNSTDVDVLRAQLPPKHAVIEYMMTENNTYAFILTRDKRVEVAVLGVHPSRIQDWVNRLQRAAVRKEPKAFLNVLPLPYENLIQPLLQFVPPGFRLVIVPDGAMHGLPFSALYDSKEKKYLIEKMPVSLAGSVRLYVYATMRDAAIRNTDSIRVALFGVGEGSTKLNLGPLPLASEEVNALYECYKRYAERHLEPSAADFISFAPNSEIIHFAGHAVANAQTPFDSYLVFANSEILTASNLLRQLKTLPRTRLVVLGACSTAGGLEKRLPIGPEGMGPLVRPFIAANVPAVVGTLWNVNDDTSYELLVSFHRHYRNGADVAVALQQAQLAMLRKHEVLAWAGYQVIGFAASPFPPPGTKEGQIEHVSRTNSLQRPDGLHSQ